MLKPGHFLDVLFLIFLFYLVVWTKLNRRYSGVQDCRQEPAFVLGLKVTHGVQVWTLHRMQKIMQDNKTAT